MIPRVFAKVSAREVRSNDGVRVEVKTRYAIVYTNKDRILLFRRDHGFIRGIHYLNFILIEENLAWITTYRGENLVTDEELLEVKRDLKTALSLLGSDCAFVSAADIPQYKSTGEAS